MTQTIPTNIDGLLKGVKTRLATLWEIYRLDGVVLRLTNADRQVRFGGHVYDPDQALVVSASLRSEGLEPGDRQISGVVSTEVVTLQHLVAGIYRGARVVERLVDRRYAWAGSFVEREYIIREVEFSDSEWTGRLQTIVSKLFSPVGELYGKNCRFSLGDSRCGVNLVRFTSPVLQVSSVSLPCNTRTEFMVDSALMAAITPEGWADFGHIVWLTGDNGGFKTEIQSESRSGSEITIKLAERTAFDIDLNDDFQIIAGCDRTLATCRDKFDNLIRFGGFPNIPGADSASETPDVTEA